MGTDDDFETWISTRPAAVQAAARKWPPGTRLLTQGGTIYVLGYAELAETDQEVALIVSHTDPRIDYEGAKASCLYVCEHHVYRTH